jgi:hypothetical protein
VSSRGIRNSCGKLEFTLRRESALTTLIDAGVAIGTCPKRGPFRRGAGLWIPSMYSTQNGHCWCGTNATPQIGVKIGFAVFRAADPQPESFPKRYPPKHRANFLPAG